MILKKIFFVLTFTILAFVPTLVLAQTPECDALKAQINQYGGGRAAELPAYCNEGVVYNKISSLLYYVLGIVAVISIIYGGYMYMTAGSNEQRKTKAKTILIYTIAGIVVALLAALIVNVVVNVVVDNKFF